jgi:hypothetical protein
VIRNLSPRTRRVTIGAAAVIPALLIGVLGAKAASAEMTAEGTRLTYLSAALLSGDDTCYCLFRGPSGQAVR